MADKTTGGLKAVDAVSIGDLPGILDLYDETLIPVEQQGEARHMTGRQWRNYAEGGVKVSVDEAKAAADAAKASKTAAEAAAETASSNAAAAAESAVKAETAEEGAEAARDAVEDMTVTSETLSPGEAATVTKTLQDGVFNIKFGIPKGEPGTDGTSFVVLGRYDTFEELTTAHPTGEEGDAWAVGTPDDNEIYLWDVDALEWQNVGSLQGPPGTPGQPGEPGAPGPGLPAGGAVGQVPVKKTDVDYETEWKDPVGKSMAGQTVEPTQGTTVTAGVGAEVFNVYSERTYDAYEEGYDTILPRGGNIASGVNSHAEGSQTTATNQGSHAEGVSTLASGMASHAEGGRRTGSTGGVASGYGSHVEGVSSKASGEGAHAEGSGTKAEGYGAHAEGESTTASKNCSHAEGYSTTAGGTNAHAEGRDTQATGGNSHAEGYAGIAEGSASHVEGGQYSNGNPNKASGYAAHTEGSSTLASGNQSHAEGGITQATGENSHAEGYAGIAEGSASHVEGGRVIGKDGSKASGYGAHAEGASTLASGDESHAEGQETVASGNNAHAEGYVTEASGNFSHAGGRATIAAANGQTAIGWANIPSENTNDIFIVGYGAVENNVVGTRANAFRVTSNGVYAKGNYSASGADYAEMFEWADGNPDHTDRAGRFVTLDGRHIRLAGPGDGYLLGIVSGNPSVVGDVYDDQWKGMYLTDVFGRPVFEDVEVPDLTETVEVPVEVPGEGDEAPRLETRLETRVVIPAHTERRQKLNPAYDLTQPYVPRSQRPEWDAVGLLGKLVAVDDGTCQVNGWATVGAGGVATASGERTKFRVMERLDESHVRIMIL